MLVLLYETSNQPSSSEPRRPHISKKSEKLAFFTTGNDFQSIWYEGSSFVKPGYTMDSDRVYCNALYKQVEIQLVIKPMVGVRLGHALLTATATEPVSEAYFLETAYGLQQALQSIDITFLLSPSVRRTHFVNIISQLAAADNLTVLHEGLFDINTLNLYDLGTKEYLEVHSKVVVSVHNGPQSVLETHRMNHLLSLGKCVISEQSALDPALDAQYSDSIIFATEADFYSLIREYATNHSKRHEVERRALLKFDEVRKDVRELSVAMRRVIERL
eukprot:gene29961-37100_t